MTWGPRQPPSSRGYIGECRRRGLVHPSAGFFAKKAAPGSILTRSDRPPRYFGRVPGALVKTQTGRWPPFLYCYFATKRVDGSSRNRNRWAALTLVEGKAQELRGDVTRAGPAPQHWRCGTMDKSTFVQWESRPGFDASPMAIKAERLPGNVTWCGVIVSRDLVGCCTHWVQGGPRATDGQTQPCIGPGCLRCAAGVKLLWKGWLHVALEVPVARDTILEITAAAGELVALHRDRVGSLNNVPFRVSRKGKTARGQMVITFGERRPGPPLEETVDVRALLVKMFGGSTGRNRAGDPIVLDHIASAM